MDPEQTGSHTPWWWRHQTVVIFITTAVVVGAVASVYLRTKAGSGSATETDTESALTLVAIALPAVVLPFVTRRWQIWVPISLLSVTGWFMLVALMGTSPVSTAVSPY